VRTARESSRSEKTKTDVSSRRRSSPARKKSPSPSSSDSEVVYGKVQSKVDIKRSEAREVDQGKLLQKRSPSPVSSSAKKGRSDDRVELKSSGHQKADGIKDTSSMKKISATYSSDSSASPSADRNSRKMQSAVVEKPMPTSVVPTERRKVVASQKPIELAPAKSPPRSLKRDQSSDHGNSPVLEKHASSSKTRSPDRNRERKLTPERKKESRETMSDTKSRSKASCRDLLEKSKKGDGLDSRRRRRSSSSAKQRKKAERDTSSDAASSPERSKPQVRPSDDRKKTRRSPSDHSSSSASESEQESPDVDRRDKTRKKSPQLQSADIRKSDTHRQRSRERSAGALQLDKRDRDLERDGALQRKTKDKKEPSSRQEGGNRQKARDRSPEKPPTGKSQAGTRSSPRNDRELEIPRSSDNRKFSEVPPRAGDKSTKVEKGKRDRSSSSSVSSSEDEVSKPVERSSGHAAAADKSSVVEMRQQKPLVAGSDSASSRSRSKSPTPPPRSLIQPCFILAELTFVSRIG